MDYLLLEKELKKRLLYPYVWGRKQVDQFDNKTNFIYKISDFNSLLKSLNTKFEKEANYPQFKNYALNRWYNFWSAKAVEHMFTSHKIVHPNPNKYDKLVDFYIEKIPFDHKTSVFPKGINKSFPYCVEHKTAFIKWLYTFQSKGKRLHYKNRIFVVLVNSENYEEHWKLKSELSWLQPIISNYLCNFNVSKLEKITLGNNTFYSDVIWAVK